MRGRLVSLVIPRFSLSLLIEFEYAGCCFPSQTASVSTITDQQGGIRLCAGGYKLPRIGFWWQRPWRWPLRWSRLPGRADCRHRSRCPLSLCQCRNALGTSDTFGFGDTPPQFNKGQGPARKQAFPAVEQTGGTDARAARSVRGMRCAPEFFPGAGRSHLNIFTQLQSLGRGVQIKIQHVGVPTLPIKMV